MDGYVEGAHGHTHPITKYRKRNDLSLSELADMVGVNKSTVYRWEIGAIKITPTKVKQLSNLIGVSKRALRPDIFG